MLKELRIVSLIPSATELVNALGLIDDLVGRSHECDYPNRVLNLPICTEPKFNPDGTSAEIHDRVTNLLESALSVYRVKTDILEALQPTHIITQAQCEVCAVSLADVEQAAAQLIGSSPKIISLQPNTIADLWIDIQTMADSFKVDAAPLLSSLQARVQFCQEQTAKIVERPTVACIEWTEPLMAAGNWVPELVEWAGGKNLFGTVGKHSPWLKWEELVSADPEVIVIMPCGFDLARTKQEAAVLAQHPEWRSLKAVRSGRVYITDGNSFFNRPGDRLVDSLEMLAEIFHPNLFNFGFADQAYRKYLNQ